MASLNGPSELQEPISESRLAMIDMGDNGEVPDPLSWVLAQIHVLFAVVFRMGAESSNWVASEMRRR